MLIHACDNGIGEHLLLPALGCYRQYFELQLRELARVGRAIRAEAGHDRRGHRLDISDITETLTHVNIIDGRSEQQAEAIAKRDLRKLKAAIDELNQLDPAAVMFRFGALESRLRPPPRQRSRQRAAASQLALILRPTRSNVAHGSLGVHFVDDDAVGPARVSARQALIDQVGQGAATEYVHAGAQSLPRRVPQGAPPLGPQPSAGPSSQRACSVCLVVGVARQG